MIPAPFWKSATAFSPIALLTHTQKIGATSSAIDTSGASLIVVATISYSSFSISDSKSNTWLTATSHKYTIDTNFVVRLLYAQSPITVGSGHTFTVTSTSTAFAVACFSNVASSPLDKTSHAQVISVGGTGGPGAWSPASDNELIIGVDGTEPGVTNVIDASTPGITLTEVEQVHGVGGVNYGILLTYGVQGSLVSQTIQFTWTGGNINLMLGASFTHS